MRNDFNQAIFEFVKNIPIPSNSDLRGYSALYESNDIIYKCVDYKAKKVAQATPTIFKLKDKLASKEYKKLKATALDSYEQKELIRLKEAAYEEIELDHISLLSNPELLRLKRFFQRPNEYNTFGQFLYSLSAYYDLAGWALIYKQYVNDNGKKLSQMYSIPTDRVTIEGNTPFDPVKGYHFDSYYQKTFDAKDCIPIRSFSVRHDRMGSHLYGTSKVGVAWQSLQTYIAAKDREYTSFKTGDSAHILFPKSIEAQNAFANDKSLFQKVKDYIFKSLRQKDDHQAAIIGQELGHINLSSTIKQSITIEAKQEIKEMIASLWSLPTKVVFNDSTTSTYNNLKEDKKRALYDGVFPFLNEIEQILQNIIFDSYGVHFGFDYQAYEELNTDRIGEMKELSDVTFLTKNEKREWFGYEPTDELTDEFTNFDYDTTGTTNQQGQSRENSL